MAKGFQVVIDCADPAQLADFWAFVLHYKLDDPPKGFSSWEEWLKAHNVPVEQWNAASAVVDPDGVSPRIFFQRVPESKAVKNRVHLDVNATPGLGTPLEERKQLVNAEVERLIPAGAQKLRTVEEMGGYFVVMTDPEGNEFCVH